MPRLILAVMLTLQWFCAECAIAQPGRPLALKSKITRVQPMTGIVLWSDNEKAKSAGDAIALEYRYCGYDEVVNADGEYHWDKIEAVLDDIAGRNHQAILRFYFCYVGKETTVPDAIRKRQDYLETVGRSEKKQTHFCDWSNRALQDFTLDFYSRFARRYDNDLRIAFLQTGFGLWAEYHIYSGPKKLGKTFPAKAYQEKFLRRLDAEFQDLPWSISIDAADYDYSPLEDNAELLALSFGLFDDSFLCKPHPGENAVNWKILQPTRWQRQPAGGEFSYYNKRDQKNALAKNGPNGIPFETAARQFHISYMIGNDQLKYRSLDRISKAGQTTGYRFEVTAAERMGNQIKLIVTNKGIAPIYRDAWFAAGSTRSKTTLRGLLPGKSIECVIENIKDADVQRISIQSDAILPGQSIEFAADLATR